MSKKGCYLCLDIIIVSIMVYVAFVSLKEWAVPISISAIAIGTFILSLICMNYTKSNISHNVLQGEAVNKYKDPVRLVFLGIITVGIMVFISALSYNVGDLGISMSAIAIGTFILSLIYMNYLTYISKKEPEKSSPTELLTAINDNIELLKQLEGIKSQLLVSTTGEDKKKLNNQIESKEEIIKLNDKKIEVLSEEPVGVLDKHEIRRSLTISLTIVYFMLLFFSIFSPVTTTTQFINMTDMSPGNISGNITVGNVTITATADKANITLSNTTTHTNPNLQSPFIEVFTYIYLAVIAFYFGSRAVETYAAMKKK